MVFPGMVYISHPTEYGTLYTKGELAELSAVCSEYRLPLIWTEPGSGMHWLQRIRM